MPKKKKREWKPPVRRQTAATVTADPEALVSAEERERRRRVYWNSLKAEKEGFYAAQAGLEIFCNPHEGLKARRWTIGWKHYHDTGGENGD